MDPLNAEVSHFSALEASSGKDTWAEQWTLEQLKDWQDEDAAMVRVRELLATRDSKPDWKDISPESAEVKSLCFQWDSLVVLNNLLYRQWVPEQAPSLPVNQLIAPRKLRKAILDHLHSRRTAGHLGVTKTTANVRQRFYWPGYREDIQRWCQCCLACQRRKPGPQKGRASLHQEPVGAPMERMALDFMGPLKTTHSGNRHILVVADYFTKWTEAFALPDQKAETVADCLVTQVFCRFGVPRQLHSDQAADFESKIIEEVCQLLQIRKSRTSPYRPQSDGLVERFNRSLQAMLGTLVSNHQDDWDDHLPYVMLAYRSTVQESTGCSPSLLMLGREMNHPIDLMVGAPRRYQGPQCTTAYAQWLLDVMAEAHGYARENLERAAEHQKRHYDVKIKSRQFKRGDWVLYYYPPYHTKLGKPYAGPFLVARRVSEVHYMIQREEGGRLKRVHVDSLKQCHFLPGEEPHSWDPPGGPEPSQDEEEDQTRLIINEDEPPDDQGSSNGMATEQQGDIHPGTTTVRRSGRASKPPLRLDL